MTSTHVKVLTHWQRHENQNIEMPFLIYKIDRLVKFEES